MGQWTWGSDPLIDLAARSTYHGLFPRSWTVFEDPTNSGTGVTVTIRQTSPFLPNDYTSSCLPTTVFEVDVFNEDPNKAKEVSVFFSFENTDGWWRCDAMRCDDERDDNDGEHFKAYNCSARKQYSLLLLGKTNEKIQ
jgi:uncharacterized protein (DUF608 family)